MLNLEYFYGAEAEQFSFIKIPKVILFDERYSKLSFKAMILYSVLLDRMDLSKKNGWFDEHNRVYIKYPLKEIMEFYGCTKKTAIGYMNELESIGLIEKMFLGKGQSNIIYVKNFLIKDAAQKKYPEVNAREPEVTMSGVNTETAKDNKAKGYIRIVPAESGVKEETSNQNKIRLQCGVNDYTTPESQDYKGEMCGEENYTHEIVDNSECGNANYTSGNPDYTQEVTETTPTEVTQITPLINNTKNNNTDFSNTKSNHILSADAMDDEMRAYERIIKANISYDILVDRYPYKKELLKGILDLLVETVTSKREEIVVGKEKRSANFVKGKLLKLNSMHIEYVIDCFENNTTSVTNPKQYMLAMLFNAPSTIDSYFTALVNHDMAEGLCQNS